ncbi:lipase family protein [Nocardia sp. NPDC059764]|uniref:lipase family protein n=1 Tax=Nocardia sp. NPDC059764 TaxID=3346939 RepID=UPI0036582B66
MTVDTFAAGGIWSPRNLGNIHSLSWEGGCAAAAPIAPLYIHEGTFDEVMPLNAVDNTYDIYCHDPSARVQYTRDLFSEHGIAAVSNMPV